MEFAGIIAIILLQLSTIMVIITHIVKSSKVKPVVRCNCSKTPKEKTDLSACDNILKRKPIIKTDAEWYDDERKQAD